MIDMLKTIVAKSDQLNSDDLIGGSITIKITEVRAASGDQPISFHYENDNGKPFKPCKNMRRVIVALWDKYADRYVGRLMTLYRDDKVTFGGMAVGGIRISHMSHIEKEVTMVLTQSKANKKPFTVKPLLLAVDQPKLSTLEIEGLKSTGYAEAQGGSEYLKAWWSNLNNDHKKALGKGWLDAMKEVAAKSDAEPITLENEVSSTCSSLAAGEVIDSEKLQDLKRRVEESGNKDLINDLCQSLPPMEL